MQQFEAIALIQQKITTNDFFQHRAHPGCCSGAFTAASQASFFTKAILLDDILFLYSVYKIGLSLLYSGLL